jgi:transcriptional regulator with XRE-family HTH domain
VALTESATSLGYSNLADQAGVSGQTLSAIVHGRTRASTSTSRKLQRAAQNLKAGNLLDNTAIIAAAREMIDSGTTTLRELARRVKEDPSNLSKVLSGKRSASRRLLGFLATLTEGI